MYPEENKFYFNIILSIINITTLFFLFFKSKINTIAKNFIAYFLIYSVIKGLTLFLNNANNIDLSQGLGAVDYTPVFIFIISILTLFRLKNVRI